MTTIKDWFADEHNRATIYRLCLALIPLLVTLDFVTGDVGNELLRAAEILLGGGASLLATRNTKRRPKHDISSELP